jgi:hypothetical protein
VLFENLCSTGIQNPFGLAIDWISRNIYVSSYSNRGASITVSKLDGAYRLMLDIPPQYLQKPNSLAVHPSKGCVAAFLYYARWFMFELSWSFHQGKVLGSLSV